MTHLDFSDGVGWLALAVTILFAFLGWLANRRLSGRVDDATSLFERMSDALERRNEIAEQALEASRDASTHQALGQPRIWLTENLKKNRYVLRNLGPGPVSGVRIDASRIDCIARDLPDGVDLEQGQSHGFLLIGTWQSGGAPDEIWVKTDEDPEWRPVKLEHIYD